MDSSSSGRNRGLWIFLICLVSLVILRIALAYVVVPTRAELALSILATIAFVSVPILALYQAASAQWNVKRALILLVVGVALHLGGALLFGQVFMGRGFGGVLFNALKDSGLVLWCFGLGVLLATRLTDKNLLLPIAIFLAGLDMFLVFAPTGPVQQIVAKRPEITRSILYSAPKLATVSSGTRGTVGSLAYVGPADFFFLAMFFVALFRFGMQTKTTLRWIVPVLIVYLLTVILFGSVRIGPLSLAMLPALVPIGLTVMIVNRREFNLNKEERLSTLVIAAIAVVLALFGIKLSRDREPVRPAASLPSAADQGVRGSAGSPSQGQ